MGAKSLATIAAACAAAFAAPGYAQEFRAPTTMFFMEVPLDAKSPREQMPTFGLQLQGSRPYQSLHMAGRRRGGRGRGSGDRPQGQGDRAADRRMPADMRA
jgi:hypothetical protein